MTLQDLIRETTRGVRESMARGAERRSRLEADLRDSRAEAVRQNEGFEAKQAVTRTRSVRVTQVEEDLARLHAEMARLKAEIETSQLARDGARQAVMESESEAGGVRKAQRTAERRSEELVKTISSLEDEQEDLQRRLKGAHVEALGQYLESLRAVLLQVRREADDLRSATAALDRLRAARDVDGAIASLCEAREEWHQILKAATVPVVRDAGRKELQLIEAEIERRFPGALQGEAASARGAETIESLYYRLDEETRRIELYLPFDHSTWQRIEQGDSNDDLAWAVSLTWGLRGQLQLDWSTSRLRYSERVSAALIDAVVSGNFKEQFVEWEHAGAVASFELAPLPAEISEALDALNTDR